MVFSDLKKREIGGGELLLSPTSFTPPCPRKQIAADKASHCLLESAKISSEEASFLFSCLDSFQTEERKEREKTRKRTGKEG